MYIKKAPQCFSPTDSDVCLKGLGEPLYMIIHKERGNKLSVLSPPFHDLGPALNTYPNRTDNVFIYVIDGINKIPLYRWRNKKEQWLKVAVPRLWVLSVDRSVFFIDLKENAYKTLDGKTHIIVGEAYDCTRSELRALIRDNMLLKRIWDNNEIEDDLPY